MAEVVALRTRMRKVARMWSVARRFLLAALFGLLAVNFAFSFEPERDPSALPTASQVSIVELNPVCASIDCSSAPCRPVCGPQAPLPQTVAIPVPAFAQAGRQMTTVTPLLGVTSSPELHPPRS